MRHHHRFVRLLFRLIERAGLQLEHQAIRIVDIVERLQNASRIDRYGTSADIKKQILVG